MFLRKGILKRCSKSTGEHPCRSAILVKLLCTFPVILLHILRKPFPKNTSGWLLLILLSGSFNVEFKENTLFVQKVTGSNLWWISNKSIIEVWSITKAATFNSFLHLNYKNTQLLFFVTVLFWYFHETDIKRWFLRVTQKYGLHISFNC